MAESIQGFDEYGIILKSGEKIELDVVVMATGFNLLDGMTAVPFYGANGEDIYKLFGDKPTAYYACLNPGAPNVFRIFGPNTGFGHFSVVHTIECQTVYALNLIQAASKAGLGSIEVTPEATEKWTNWIQDGLKSKVWSLRKEGYYSNDDGYNFTIWPFTGMYMAYVFKWRKPRLDDFVRK